MTVGELRSLLEQYDEDAPVRVAIQPSYPLACVVNNVISREEMGGEPERDEAADRVVWIATSQVGSYSESPYAPRDAWS